MFTVDLLAERRLSRRLTLDADHSVEPGLVWQALDVDVRLEAGTTTPYPAVPGYDRCAVDIATQRLNDAAALGLRGLSVRVIDDPVANNDEWGTRRNVWLLALRELTAAAKEVGVQVVVDPFSAALQPGGQWGLLDHGDKAEEQTLRLLSELADVVSSAGADGIITLGRVPREVATTKAVVGDSAKIYSFSTNSETVTAYAGHGNHASTNQKILPGNTTDMMLWSLLDVHSGTDVLVTKPIENFHTVVEIRQLLGDAERLRAFVSSEGVVRALAGHPVEAGVIDAIREDPGGFVEQSSRVALGAYTVSGTTQMLATLATVHGVELARGRHEEMWVNAAAAATGRDFSIIDRGASAFFRGTVLH